MGADLTSRQQAVLRFIQEWMDEHGMPPTRAEICAGLGFRSPNAAESHLRALARKGVIEMVAGASRGIRLCLDAMEPDLHVPEGLPVVGRVAAGEPILAAAHIDEYQPLAPEMFHPAADYLLRVHGMSMRDAGILDGDLLAVHAVPTAETGQIVVARLDDEVTVKRFRRRGHKVSLLPENPDFSPIEVDLRQQSLVIEGRAVGLLRDHPPQ